jgi:hypothetical protein
MKIRTFDKKTAIHVSNLISLVVAWSVTGSYFGWDAAQGNIGVIAFLLSTPAHLLNEIALLLGMSPVLGNFNAMLFTLWISYALIGRLFYPLLMVQAYTKSELREWYFTKSEARI